MWQDNGGSSSNATPIKHSEHAGPIQRIFPRFTVSRLSSQIPWIVSYRRREKHVPRTSVRKDKRGPRLASGTLLSLFFSKMRCVLRQYCSPGEILLGARYSPRILTNRRGSACFGKWIAFSSAYYLWMSFIVLHVRERVSVRLKLCGSYMRGLPCCIMENKLFGITDITLSLSIVSKCRCARLRIYQFTVRCRMLYKRRLAKFKLPTHLFQPNPAWVFQSFLLAEWIDSLETSRKNPKT